MSITPGVSSTYVYRLMLSANGAIGHKLILLHVVMTGMIWIMIHAEAGQGYSYFWEAYKGEGG